LTLGPLGSGTNPSLKLLNLFWFKFACAPAGSFAKTVHWTVCWRSAPWDQELIPINSPEIYFGLSLPVRRLAPSLKQST
jgi:hypothetical protein